VIDATITLGTANPFVERVTAPLLDHLPALTERLFEQLVVADPFYESVAPLMGDEIRQSIDENLGQLLRGLAGIEPLDLDLPRQLARRRAEQGVPVAALLHAYRLASQLVLNELVDSGRSWGRTEYDEDTVLWGILELFPLINEYSSAISQTYDDTVTDRARRSERDRTLLLDALFEGRTQDLPLTREVSRVLDLPDKGTLVVVVAETASPGEEGLPNIEQVLRLRALRSTWRLHSHRQIGIVVLGTDRVDARLDEVRHALESLTIGRVGVSPTYLDLVDTSRFATLADIARQCLPPHERGVALFDDHPIAALVAGSPEVGERMARLVLGPMITLPVDERDLLFETLEVWISVGGSAPRTAERLSCHRNTIRNRLQRIELLTKRSLDDPATVSQVCLAVQAFRLLIEPKHPSASTPA
jgi:hypothetical protein